MSKKTFIPAFTAGSLKYKIEKKSSHLWHLNIEVPASLSLLVRDHITRMYRQYTIMPGVSCSNLPLTYTEHYFAQEIERDTQLFLQEHFIENNTQDFLKDNKITIVNWPRFHSVSGGAPQGYVFTIALSLAPTLSLQTWKAQSFSAPKRKNYTDLDAQVDSFMSTLRTTGAPEESCACPGDWVRFSATFRTPAGTAAVHTPMHYWLRITSPVLTTPTMQPFLNAVPGATFMLPASALSSSQEIAGASEYSFQITIESIVKTEKLSLDQVKASLQAQDQQALHDKLIEVFSYRNDISLRKAIIEELFYSLFNAFRFEIAPHAVTRRKELLLFLMQQSPDNSVYTKHKNFAAHITMLAEAKLKEEALIDALAQEEEITITPKDIMEYLALASNERLKEFLYFSPLTEETLSAGHPCGEYILEQTVRREKTLNKIITQLAV